MKAISLSYPLRKVESIEIIYPNGDTRIRRLAARAATFNLTIASEMLTRVSEEELKNIGNEPVIMLPSNLYRKEIVFLLPKIMVEPSDYQTFVDSLLWHQRASIVGFDKEKLKEIPKDLWWRNKVVFVRPIGDNPETVRRLRDMGIKKVPWQPASLVTSLECIHNLMSYFSLTSPVPQLRLQPRR